MRRAVLALALLGCARSTPAPAVTPDPVASTSVSTTPDGVRVLGRTSPLEGGRVAFEGVVRPTKGGFDVRGVSFDDGAFRAQLAGFVDGKPADPDWFLGALVRVTTTLEKRHVASATDDAGLVMQTKVGDFFVTVGPVQIELRANAVLLEGTLVRSKGYFGVGGRLVDPADVAWALAGAKVGAKVRLFGQPYDYKCAPEAQCLVGGVLPLFDVGRGEVVP